MPARMSSQALVHAAVPTCRLAVSLAITAPANLLTALAPDHTVVLIGRILTAAALGLFWAVVVSYVATIVEPRRLGWAL